MDPSRPRAGGPTHRRSFTSAQKLEHLASDEAAVSQGRGGAYLSQEGLCSSQITEWRELRDAGVLAGRSASAKVGRLTAEQSEFARLRRQLDLAERRLSRTEAALLVMGKAHALLEEISESAQELEGRGVGFRSLTESIDTTTPGGRLVFHIFGSLAQFERELVKERTMAGLAAARARGRTGGRPTVMTTAKTRAAQRMISAGTPLTEVASVLGVGRATLYRYLQATSPTA